ncbi:MAG TPA: MipA/OmpV family protein [Azospirillaceae bacterium]|nr:MipA/OmpV family protein [Azospirillaceae bacterium]
MRPLPAALLLASIAAMPAVPMAAERDRPPASGDWSLRVGVLAAVAPDYEGSDRYEAVPLPDIEITYGDRLFLDRRGLGATLVATDSVRAGVALGYGKGRREKENSDLRGLGSVGDTATGTVFGAYRAGPLTVSLDVTGDVLGEGSEGMTATLGASYAAELSDRLLLVAGPSLTWADGNHMRAFFGVSPEQARRSRLPAYRAGAGLQKAGAGVQGIYRLSDQWSATALAGYARLLGDAADSPLVRRDGDRDQLAGGLGLSYRFR